MPNASADLSLSSGASRSFGAEAAATVARFFDAENAGYADDVATLLAFARRTGGPLLELGCGTGRLLLRLAKSGYRVTGVDISLEMLNIARGKLLDAGVVERATLVQGDYAWARLDDAPGPYAFAFVVMNTFMHLLSQKQQLQALTHWRSYLAPGGLLLIDVFQPDMAELAAMDGKVEFDKSWIDPKSGATVMKQVIRTVDQTEQILHLSMIYDEIGASGILRRTVVPFDLRYLWRFEAELLLDKAGYVVENVYGDWDLAPLEAASERMILLARRRD